MDQDLNVRAKIIKFLKENFGVNHQDFGFGRGFLDRTPKTWTVEENKSIGLHQKLKFIFLKVPSRQR